MDASKKRLASVVLLLLHAAGLGCGDDTGTGGTGAGGSGGTGGSGGLGGSGGTGGGLPSVTISGQVFTFPDFDPVEDGDVCFIADGAEERCTPTGVNGAYSIANVPANTAGGLRFRADAIVNFYWMVATGTTDFERSVAVDTPAMVQSYYTQAAVTPSADGVVVAGQIFVGVQAGAVAVLTPSSGQGPYYWLDDVGTLDLGATETSEAGVGLGLFLDVSSADGPFTLHFERDGICDTPDAGAKVPAWEIPADADEVFVQFECP